VASGVQGAGREGGPGRGVEERTGVVMSAVPAGREARRNEGSKGDRLRGGKVGGRGWVRAWWCRTGSARYEGERWGFRGGGGGTAGGGDLKSPCG